ncbi:MAG: DnaA regulatory inactivator Hda [Pseudomonadota bacterium]
MTRHKQLPLQFQHFQEQNFSQFIFGSNDDLLPLLNDPLQNIILLWGNEFSGKTHLLSALYHQYLQENKSAIYLPLSMKKELSVEMLENIEFSELICIDDIDAIAGDRVWEEALFSLYNQMRDSGHKLLIAAKNNALNINFCLNDLKSRLQWGLTYKLKPLVDADKIQLLQNRAEMQGFSLADDVAAFLLNRVSRNLSDLIQLLDKLDYASLSEQRKLTIPFVRKYLNL